MKILILIPALVGIFLAENAESKCRLVVKPNYQALKCDGRVPVVDDLSGFWEFTKRQVSNPSCIEGISQVISDERFLKCTSELTAASYAIGTFLAEGALSETLATVSGIRTSYLIIDESRNQIKSDCEGAIQAYSKWTSRPECFRQPPKKPVNLASMRTRDGKTFLYDYQSRTEHPFEVTYTFRFRNRCDKEVRVLTHEKRPWEKAASVKGFFSVKPQQTITLVPDATTPLIGYWAQTIDSSYTWENGQFSPSGRARPVIEYGRNGYIMMYSPPAEEIGKPHQVVTVDLNCR